jgi:hypothetical protein
VTVTGVSIAGDWLAEHEALLSTIRRELHAHPELGRHEFATTALLAGHLERAGLAPKVLETGTGLICDIGTGDGPIVALRADIDALPLADIKDVPYRSQVAGVCHACGHDVHTAALLGAGLALADHADRLPGRVRLVFQPAEEVMPGCARRDRPGRDGRGRRHLRPALRPGPRGRAGRAEVRPHHRRGRHRRGAALRPGRSHLPSAQHR